MFISPISAINVNLPAKKMQAKKSHSSNVRTQNVSFTGTYHAINSARKYVDYGDIFKEGAKFIADKTKLDFNGMIIPFDLKKANKTGADLRKSVWENVNANKCYLPGIMLHNAQLTNVDFIKARLEGAQFIDTATDHVNMRLANLSNAVFKGDKFGPWTLIYSANLCGADLKDVSGIEKGVNFDQSFYNYSTQFPKDFDPEYFDMILITKGADFSNSYFAFRHAPLRCTEFDTINFEDLDLIRADLKQAKFSDCNMHKTGLKKAYLKSSEFNNCDLSESTLKRAVLTNAKLNSVDLRNANLKGAQLDWHTAQDVKLDGAKYDQYTVFKEGFNPRANGMIYEHSSEDINSYDY